MTKEYCIFRKVDGSFVFTSTAEPKAYIDNVDYEIVVSNQLEPGFQYSLVDGEIIKGDKDPEIIE